MFDGDALGLGVQVGNFPGQRVDVSGHQLASGQHVGQQAALWKLAHLQYVVEDRSVAAELRSLEAAGHRQDLQVDIRGGALVEAQFLVAEVLAGLAAAEVEKAEVHRLLQLVGVLAGEQDPGDMRLDDFEALHRVGVQGGVLQGFDQGLGHRRSFSSGTCLRPHYGDCVPPCKPSGVPSALS
ncbi:hypothetical protein D3C80_1433710 [compost metagenome]